MTDVLRYPSLEIADAAPAWMIEQWYKGLPRPKTDEEKDVMERICLRSQGQPWEVKYK